MDSLADLGRRFPEVWRSFRPSENVRMAPQPVGSEYLIMQRIMQDQPLNTLHPMDWPTRHWPVPTSNPLDQPPTLASLGEQMRAAPSLEWIGAALEPRNIRYGRR